MITSTVNALEAQATMNGDIMNYLKDGNQKIIKSPPLKMKSRTITSMDVKSKSLTKIPENQLVNLCSSNVKMERLTQSLTITSISM